MESPLKLGILGCGNISPQYFKGARLYSQIEVVACADIVLSVAQSRAAEFEVPSAVSVDDLLEMEGIDIVVNLTTPQFHTAINERILESGKHAYCEKPFATKREDGLKVLELARAKGLRVGCAPDTFLSAPMQTARKLIDDGLIGRPIGGTAFFACPGHERWHPNPDFYYKPGGGPIMDMAPYYYTVLANLFGPVESVFSAGMSAFRERHIAGGKRAGESISVETITHASCLVGFENGVQLNAMFSFDVQGLHDLPLLTVYGTEGTLSLPDPNCFDGQVKISRPGDSEWESLSLQHNYKGARSLGVADMAAAIEGGKPHRANGELAYHIFDTMVACEESVRSGKKEAVTSRFERLPGISSSEGEEPLF